jgi:hypothetical protein
MKRLLAVLIILLLTLPVFTQEGQTVYVLVKANQSWNPSDPGTWDKGYPVYADVSNQYIGQQVLPDFVQFVITDATSLQALKDSYVIPWNRVLDWDVTQSSLNTDTHTIELFVKPELVSASGKNRITRAEVESFLTGWKATVNSISLGRVRFTASVYDAMTSSGFWGTDVSTMTWSQNSYDKPTGVHVVNMFYSAYPGSITDIRIRTAELGCTEQSFNESQHRVTFRCARSAVLDVFKQSVKDFAEAQYSPAKWRFTDAAIDAAAAAGGSLNITQSQIPSLIHNRLSD